MLGVGIIGYGRIGAEHAGWIASSGAARVVAVADPTAERRVRAEADGHATTENVQELIKLDAVQAILVATPTSMHHEVSMQALRAGRHVMVEKPMTLTAPQARELIELAEQRGLALSVFHNRRWDADYLTLRHAVRQKVFGHLISVESRLHQYASCVGPAAREYRPGWRNEAAFGGGGLYDWGSHFVDQMWRLMLPAKPLRVFAQLRGNVWSNDCDDFARVLIDFDSGATGLVEINTTTAAPLPRWHVDGVHASAQSPTSPQFDVNAWAQFTLSMGFGGGLRDLPRAAPGLNESAIWQQFASAVEGETDPAVTPRSVLPTMMLLDAARTSSERGEAVQLDWSSVECDWRDRA